MPSTIRNMACYFTLTASTQARKAPCAYSRLLSLLLAGLVSYGAATGALVSDALAASVIPAQTTLTHVSFIIAGSTDTTGSKQTIIAPKAVIAQPMPPMPEQVYNAQLHEGSVALNADASFTGIDPFITGPVSK